MANKPSKGGTVRAGDYAETLNTAGYNHNREITNLPGQYLVFGSQNTMIHNTEKVQSRPGYTLLGSSKTVNQGIHSSYDWNGISSGSKRSLRAYGTTLEFFYKGAWTWLFTLPTSTHMEFTTWWNTTEQIDVLLACNGTGKVLEWSGGATTLASVTAASMTKQRYVSSNTMTISFQNNGTGQPGTIKKSDGGFIVAGFQPGDSLVISGSTSNDQTVIIQSVNDTALVIMPDYVITTEVPPLTQNIILMEPNGTWAGQRFFTVNAGNSTNRQVTVLRSDGTTKTYTYTGGETTGTLTGVSLDPTADSLVTGSTIVQTIRTYTVATGAGQNPGTAYAINLISMVGNCVFYGSSSNRQVFQSKTTSFIDCAWTNPLRVPGEGMTINLDSCPTALIPGQKDSSGQDQTKMYITAGTDDIYEVKYKQSTQTTGGTSFITETVLTNKFNTATGSAAISQGAVVFVRNSVVYTSFEPTIDTLQHQANIVTTTPNAKPISDPIREDLENYDRRGIHGVYFKRAIFYTLPKEAKMIMYDMSNDNFYWQPPWTVGFSRLAIIEIDGVLKLCAHSSATNESYTLFDGTNDNGAAISQIAAFGYENYGSRFSLKNLDELATELYLSASTKVKVTINYDYKGGTDVRDFVIDGNDSDIIQGPIQTKAEGSAPEGTNPEGSLPDKIDFLRKARIIHETPALDFFERQRIFSCSGLDDQFAIVAYGDNAQMSDNQPNAIRK